MITKEEFHEFRKLTRRKELYDLMTALRGTDYGYPFIKYLFTARIRYFLGVSKKYGEIRTTKTIFPIDNLLVLKDIEQARKESMERHYFDHINSALEALKNNRLIKEDEWNILLNLSVKIANYVSYIDETNKEIVEWLDKITCDGRRDRWCQRIY